MAYQKYLGGKIYSNRLVRYCILILSIICIISILAYAIIPDNTENANRQIPEIALSPPGTTYTFIEEKRNINRPQNGIFKSFASGQLDLFEYTPFDTLYTDNDNLISIFKTASKIHGVVVSGDVAIKTKKINYLLGTDKYGRDVLSRLVLGLRVSLFVGLFSVFVSIGLGISIGSLGGYYGGRVDKIIMLIVNTSWSIPTLLMAFAIIIALGKGLLVIVFAVGLTMWVDVARIVRGQTMQVKNELYVKASKIMGFSDMRIIYRHILPNIAGSILVIAAANFATAILVEAGLSYLGLGIQPPTPSLGNMLQESYAYATGGFVYLAIFPILTIMVLVLCFNLLGTGLRDVFDIKSLQT